jgi:ribose transport system substrate-binding protein
MKGDDPMFRKGVLARAALVLAACTLAGAAHAQVATGDTTQKKIALSNSFAGNAWRQSMLKSWNAVAQQAVTDKKIAAAPAFTTAENQVAQQVLAGKKIPKEVTINVPLLAISQQELPAKLAATPPGGIADVTYTLPQTVALLDKK